MSNHGTLPHLPKGMAIPKIQVTDQPRMPGQKDLPPADWKNDSGKQLIRGNDARRSNRAVTKQGVPFTERQSRNQLDSNSPPPPMFSANPKRALSLRHPIDSKSQHHVYRMETGIDPVTLLVGRLEAWEHAIKDIVALFKKVYVVEEKAAKGLIASSREVTIPFKGEGQFLEGGGIQEVWSAMRDYTMQRGILHHESGDYIKRAVIPSFRAIKADIKNMVNSISKDKSLKSDSIFQSRMEVDRMVARLENAIEFFHRDPQRANQNIDPFLVNLTVIYAIRELCDNENQLHDNILTLQRETGMFEGKIIENCRYIILKLQEFRMKNKIDSRDYIGRVIETFNTISPSSEWNEFVRRNHSNLVSEASSYKTEDMVEYPNKDNRLVRAIKVGPLQYKTGALRNWTEGVNILTPAGFLHGYKSAKHFQNNPLNPSYSIFLPQAIVVNSEHEGITFEIRGKERRQNVGLGARYMFRGSSTYDTQEWFACLARMTDQFRTVPLLDTAPSGFSSNVPRSRDLPPIPDNVLPLPGQQPFAAIENSHSHLDPVQEYEEEEYDNDEFSNQRQNNNISYNQQHITNYPQQQSGHAGPSKQSRQLQNFAEPSQQQHQDQIGSQQQHQDQIGSQLQNQNHAVSSEQHQNHVESSPQNQKQSEYSQQNQYATREEEEDPYRDPGDEFECYDDAPVATETSKVQESEDTVYQTQNEKQLFSGPLKEGYENKIN